MQSFNVHLIYFVSYFFRYLYASTIFYYLNMSKGNALNSHQNDNPQALQLNDHGECNRKL